MSNVYAWTLWATILTNVHFSFPFYSLIADESENQVRDMAILQQGKFTKRYNDDNILLFLFKTV